MKTFWKTALFALLPLTAFAGDRDVDLNPEVNRIYTPDAINLLISCGKEANALQKEGFKVFVVSQKNLSTEVIEEGLQNDYSHETVFYYGKERGFGGYQYVDSLTATWSESCIGEVASDGGCSTHEAVKCERKTVRAPKR